MYQSIQPVSLCDLATATQVLLDACDWEAPGCVTYSNFRRVNGPFGAHHEEALWLRAVHKIPAVVLGKLPYQTDLLVPSGEDFLPVTAGLEVVAEQVAPYSSSDDLSRIAARLSPTSEINKAGVLIGRYGIRTWGHWLGELLPKILAVEETSPGKYEYILPREVESNEGFRPLVESLNYYRIGLDRLILLNPGRYRLRELYVVSSVWSPTKMHPDAAELMRRSVATGLSEHWPAKIALLRNESPTRNIANLSAVTGILDAAGFQTISIGRLSFAEQVQAFTAAETVAGILGSGFTGLIYAKHRVKVLSLAPSHWGDLFFFSLMQQRDATVSDIRGLQAPGDVRSPAAAKFVLDPEEIANGLAALG